MPGVKAQVYQQENKQSEFALKFKDYQIFLTGSMMTRTGDWMDVVALNWAVLQYTTSPLALGIINACRLVPVFLLSVPAGMLADRYDRRKLLIYVQSGIMVLTFILSYLIAAGQPFWTVASLVTVRAALASMDPPIRHALVPSLVSAPCLASAIAIDTGVINIARIAGPALAGWLLTLIPISYIFMINGCAALFVIISLLMIRPLSFSAKRKEDKKNRSFRKAVLFIRNHPPVQSLMILAVAPMIFGFPYTTMLPLIVDDLMDLGPESFGLFLAVSSIGAIAGMICLSIMKTIHKPGRWLILAIIGFGLALVFLMFATESIVVTSYTLFVIGFTSQLYRTLSRITLQKQVPDRLRGRILSVALMDRGFIPVGAIILGTIASYFGAFWTGIVMGLGCIITTLCVLFMRRKIWDM